jgi:hypothetical protein
MGLPNLVGKPLAQPLHLETANSGGSQNPFFCKRVFHPCISSVESAIGLIIEITPFTGRGFTHFPTSNQPSFAGFPQLHPRIHQIPAVAGSDPLMTAVMVTTQPPYP